MLTFREFLQERVDLKKIESDAKKQEYINGKIDDDKFVETFYKMLLPELKETLEVFKKVVMGAVPKKGISEKPKLLFDIKQLKGVKSKVERGKNVKDIGDYVRGAVLFGTKEDADAFVEGMKRSPKVKIIAAEEKKKGGDKMYGYYGSHHLDLEVNGLKTELQVMTKKLWTYKHDAHNIYTANRTKPGGASPGERARSKGLFTRGNTPSMRREEFDHDWIGVTLSESTDEANFFFRLMNMNP